MTPKQSAKIDEMRVTAAEYEAAGLIHKEADLRREITEYSRFARGGNRVTS